MAVPLILCMLVNSIFATEPNPPNWPSAVHVFGPGNDASVQSTVDSIFATNGGTYPEAWNGQWSDQRFALLFLPGTYNIDVNVGYYTSVIGLGANPSEVHIRNVIASNGDTNYTGGALNNFWRNAENFETTPTISANDQPNTMLWAVSQGVSLRRVIINGNLDLYEGEGYASGGYLSDSYIVGSVNSGSQQQWFTRNVIMKQWMGKHWNFMWMGCDNEPQDNCANGVSLATSIAATPIIAEKPFISWSNGKYYLMIPGIEYNKIGPTNFNVNSTNIQSVDFENVYVTNPDTETAASVNAKIAQGLHIVFTGGNYNFTEAIQVTQSNIVILGIGYPTIMAMNGNNIMEVADNLEGIRIAGIMFQAGPITSEVLLKFGETGATGTGYNFLYDIWGRVGGPNNPNEQQWSTDVMVQINSNNVILDNAWLWRADHDVTGQVYSCMNPCKNALEVYGDNVITYSLKAEHVLENMVDWFGNNGTAYFFQSEFPYDVTQAQYGDPGYNAFRINDGVTSFTGYAMGMYSFFRDYQVTVNNAIQSPNTSDIHFYSVCTIWLNGMGEISHVINGEGCAANSDYRDTPAAVCNT